MGSTKKPETPEVQPAIAPVTRESEEVQKMQDQTRRKYLKTSRQRSNLVENYSTYTNNRQTTGGM